MNDLPPPLTPADCDLRGMPYMPLDIVRLFDSDFYALSNGDEFKAGLSLWGKAFLQVPAGSLPKDDRLLAHLSGAGANWRKVKEMALRGWIECSDGRLYHQTVAEKALEAWKARLDRRARTEAARAARQAARADSSNEPPPTVTEPATTSVTDNVTRIPTRPVTVSVTGSKGTEGKGREGNKKERKKDSEADASDAPGASLGVREALWSEGLEMLRQLTGHSDRQARPLLGRLCREAGDDCAVVTAALLEARDLRPGEPIPWLMEAVKARRRPINPFAAIVAEEGIGRGIADEFPLLGGSDVVH